MKIVTDIDGNKFTTEEANLTPYVGGPQKRAKILKSFRTVEGAEGYINAMKGRLEGAIVIKSLDGYDEYCDVGGMALPAPPMQTVHIVLEEDMGIIADTVVTKNGDEMFSTMYRKGLIEVNGSSVMPSGKFFEMLESYTSSAISTYMKSADPELDKTDDGKPMIDVITEAYEVIKKSSSPENLALSQEEADNKEGDTRTDSLGDEKGAAEEALGGRVQQGSDSPPETQGVSQEEASNLDGGGRTTAISDAEVKSKIGDVQIMKSLYVFKSLTEAQQFSRKNPSFLIEPTTITEKNTLGKRYNFAAREKSAFIRK